MAGQLFDGLAMSVSSCFSWFDTAIRSLGFSDIIIGAFTVSVIYRFLLKPLVGGGVGKSDRAKKSSSGKNKEASADE